jgi:Family of unknown function (DUF6625)
MMLRKVILQTQFGSPHPWTAQYFANFKTLEPYGWYLKVFTPNDWKSEANIEIVPMTLGKFDALIELYCGVNPKNFIENGRPHKLVSDYYPAYGHIFRDYLKGFDYWGHTNWDVVYGRLDRYIPDSELEKWDIWSNDPNAINGIFCLYRNSHRINNLFRQVPNWEHSFTTHEPCAFDEHQMSRLARGLAAKGEIYFGFPRYFAYESYDRLPQHQPTPQIYLESDGGLIEWFKDPQARPPGTARPGLFGREIAMFHFRHSKQWPLTVS